MLAADDLEKGPLDGGQLGGGGRVAAEDVRPERAGIVDIDVDIARRERPIGDRGAEIVAPFGAVTGAVKPARSAPSLLAFRTQWHRFARAPIAKMGKLS